MIIQRNDVELLLLMIKEVAPEDTGNLKKNGFNEIEDKGNYYEFTIGNELVPYADYIKLKGTGGKVKNEWYYTVCNQWARLMEAKYRDVSQ